MRNAEGHDVMRVTVLNKTGGGMSGGYRKYLREMVPRLAEHEAVEALQCIAPASWRVASWVPVESVSALFEYPASRMARLPQQVRAVVDQFAPDVVFVPAERYAAFGRRPVVNMLRNFEPFADGIPPGSLVERLTINLRRRDARRAIRSAQRVIVPSEFVRNYLIANERVAPDRVVTVPFGVDVSEEHSTYTRPVIDGQPLEPGFVFTAGSIRPARGLEDVIRALAGLRDDRSGVNRLVIAGEAGRAQSRYLGYLQRLCQRLELADRVIWAGQLDRGQLNWTFSNCSAFAMTTRAETFSHIAVEALSHGCAIVATDSSCLPEILGNAACYYRPGDVEGLVSALRHSVAADQTVRAARAAASRRQTASFDWDQTASRSVAVLAEAGRLAVRND